MLRILFDTIVPGSIRVEDQNTRNIFNDDLALFVPRHVQITEVYKTTVLDGHFHKYEEVYCILKGRAEFTLRDLKTQEEKSYTMTEGKRLLISAGIAHKATIDGGSIFIHMAGETFISPKHNDNPFRF